MKIRLRYIWLVGASLLAGLVLIVTGLWVGIPYGLFPGRDHPPIPVQTDEPVRRSHEVLIRMNREYAARLKSMQDLRLARLAPAQYASAEDEVLSGVAYLLKSSASPADASKAARDRLTTLSAQIGGILGRAGLDMGPAMSPRLILGRVKDPTAQRQIGGRIYQVQFAACVDALLASMAAQYLEQQSHPEVSR